MSMALKVFFVPKSAAFGITWELLVKQILRLPPSSLNLKLWGWDPARCVLFSKPHFTTTLLRDKDMDV